MEKWLNEGLGVQQVHSTTLHVNGILIFDLKISFGYCNLDVLPHMLLFWW